MLILTYIVPEPLRVIYVVRILGINCIERRLRFNILPACVPYENTVIVYINIIDICIQILILVKYIFPHVHDRKPAP